MSEEKEYELDPEVKQAIEYAVSESVIHMTRVIMNVVQHTAMATARVITEVMDEAALEKNGPFLKEHKKQ